MATQQFLEVDGLTNFIIVLCLYEYYEVVQYNNTIKKTIQCEYTGTVTSIYK